jgi:hypothetical protein
MTSAPSSFGATSLNPAISTSLDSFRSNLGYPLSATFGSPHNLDSTAGTHSTMRIDTHPRLLSVASAIEQERRGLVSELLARPGSRAFSGALSYPGLFSGPLASVNDAPMLPEPWAQGDSSIQVVLRESQQWRHRRKRAHITSPGSVESKKPASFPARLGISHHTFPLPALKTPKPFCLRSVSTFQTLWEKFQAHITTPDREQAFQKELFSRVIASTDGRGLLAPPSGSDSGADNVSSSRKRKR